MLVGRWKPIELKNFKTNYTFNLTHKTRINCTIISLATFMYKGNIKNTGITVRHTQMNWLRFIIWSFLLILINFMVYKRTKQDFDSPFNVIVYTLLIHNY